MTTEPTDLREKIARALSEHWRDMHTNEALGQQRMLADAVLPIVLSVQVEALRDAARDIEARDNAQPGMTAIHAYRNLRLRADMIERSTDDEF